MTKMIRHEVPERKIEGVTYLNGEDMDAIQDHIEKHIGPVEDVFHEILSDIVHLDVCFVKPTEKHNFYTICTMGMSTLPMMKAPKDDYQYAEVFMCLQPDWNLSESGFKNEENYWPIRLLKALARLPHEYNTWLFYGHSMPNGDPAEPYAPNTGLTNAILLEPFIIEEDMVTADVNGKVVYFFPVFPLYKDEMQYKFDNGSDALIELMKKNKITEVLDAHRKSMLK